MVIYKYKEGTVKQLVVQEELMSFIKGQSEINKDVYPLSIKQSDCGVPET